MSPYILDRFWSKVNKTKDCWNWLAGTQRGYGAFWTGRILMRAHRFSWCIHNGDVTAMHVLHHCDNPLCVRPDHLFTGSNMDNIKDRMNKGRSGVSGLRGETHGCSKLTDTHVRVLRAYYPAIEQMELAEIFGLTQGHVSAIIRRAAWRHI